MKTSDVIAILKKIEETRKEVEDYIKKEIKEDYLLEEISKINNEIALFLISNIEKSSEITHIFKPKSIEEYYDLIKEKIILGSHSEIIINEANRIREKFVKDEWDIDKIYYPHDFDDYKNNSWKYIHVAKEIEKHVRDKIKYISEPDDIIYPAPKILEQGYGDCDDFTVLLSSLFRSLNFKVCIGFIKNHIFSSLVLPSAEVYEDEKTKINIKYVIVPVDNIRFKLRYFKEEITIYDFLDFFSNFRERLINLILEGKLEIMEEINKKLKISLAIIMKPNISLYLL